MSTAIAGTPRREFLHVDDLASAVVHLMGTYEWFLANQAELWR